MIRNFKYSFEQLNLSMEIVEKIMGYAPGASPDPIPDMITSALKKSRELSAIEGGIYISDKFKSDRENGGFWLDDKYFEVGAKISALLRKSEGAALFLCTVGKEISEYGGVLMAKGEVLEGYIFDIIGSLSVESAMNLIHDTFEKEMRDAGVGITNRYSPGYCEWSVGEQQKLFSFFPERFCGVELTESSLMTPVKSVSGIIGFGAEAKRLGHECSLCNLKSCIYRK
jgi:hypothetical protein